jgi:hypothetical protein
MSHKTRCSHSQGDDDSLGEIRYSADEENNLNVLDSSSSSDEV